VGIFKRGWIIKKLRLWRRKMSHKVIVFRVSREFLGQINRFCEEEKITYSELFHKAIEYLCKKYLRGENDEGKSNRGEDRLNC
jgi:hypothetical protein